jgi:ASCH domain
MVATQLFRALSVRQPWAWALIYGVKRPKRIENRSWSTRHRGDLVIHASKGLVDWQSRSLDRWREEIPDLPDLLAEPFERHFGCLYGLLDLVDDLPFSEVQDQPFAEGPRCWITEDPRPIEPVPYRGQQGFFDVPADLVRCLSWDRAAIPRELERFTLRP